VRAAWRRAAVSRPTLCRTKKTPGRWRFRPPHRPTLRALRPFRTARRGFDLVALRARRGHECTTPRIGPQVRARRKSAHVARRFSRRPCRARTARSRRPRTGTRRRRERRRACPRCTPPPCGRPRRRSTAGRRPGTPARRAPAACATRPPSAIVPGEVGGGVRGRVDAHRDDHRALVRRQLADRRAEHARLERTEVLADRVHERDHDRPAAQRRKRDRSSLLVVQRE